jgi:hypothetical protein
MPTLTSLIDAGAAYAQRVIHLPPEGAALVVLVIAGVAAMVGGRTIGFVVRAGIIVGGVLIAARLAGVAL